MKDPFLVAQEFKEKEEKFEGRPEDYGLEFLETKQVSYLSNLTLDLKRRFGLNEIIEGKLDRLFELSNSNKMPVEDLTFVKLLTFSSKRPYELN